MTWLMAGGLLLCLAPVAGAAIVAGLLAFHELRGRASRLALSRVGRRASTVLLEEFLAEAAAESGQQPRNRRRVPARRSVPVLLYEVLDERQPRPVASRLRAVPTRAPRPGHLVPLTA